MQVKPERGAAPSDVAGLNVQFTVSTSVSSGPNSPALAFWSWNSRIVAAVNETSVMSSHRVGTSTALPAHRDRERPDDYHRRFDDRRDPSRAIRGPKATSVRRPLRTHPSVTDTRAAMRQRSDELERLRAAMAATDGGRLVTLRRAVASVSPARGGPGNRGANRLAIDRRPAQDS